MKLLIPILTFSLIAPVSAQFIVPKSKCSPGGAHLFEATTQSYRLRNAQLCAHLANLAYPRPTGMATFRDTASQRSEYAQRLRSILVGPARIGRTRSVAGWGFRSLTTFRNASTDTEGYIASTPGYTMITLRGTELSDVSSGIRDWMTNLSAIGKRLGGGSVHGGFLDAARSVLGTIVSQLRASHGYRPSFVVRGRRIANRAARRPIWLNGHSLGGALANLLAFELRTVHGLPVRGCYTTGQPMVGNQAFANSYLRAGLVLHRAVVCSDIVAQVVGELAYIPEDLQRAQDQALARLMRNIPDPIRATFMALWTIVTSPSRLFQGTSSFMNDLMRPVGVTQVHFGTLDYFDQDRRRLRNPSLRTRRDDRVDRNAEAIYGALRRFEAPRPPASLFDFAGWARYWAAIGRVVDQVGRALTNPGPILAALSPIATRGISDHGLYTTVYTLPGVPD